MTMHTEGPWEQEAPYGHLVIDRAGNLVADCARPEDARRIVACVNACEGISTEQLDSWLCMSRPIRKSLEELKAEADREGKQRDDLIAVLQRIADGQEMSGTYTFADVAVRYQEIARAAIARAAGEQP